jgi:putative N6-adenine-specific DNA methylase
VSRPRGPRGTPGSRVDAFAVCAPGLEAMLLDEVSRLGVGRPVARHGGVSCSATWPQVWAMNLQLRTATRVIVRVARFDADGFESMRAGVRRVQWQAWLPEDARVDITVSATASKLFHTGAVQERVAEAMPDPGEGAAATLMVRIVRDEVTLSLDTSGEPLYRRGWRYATSRAPLRETLAAGLLLASGWDRRSPLVDPFCGAGTIPIEAHLLARRIPPGRARSFAFQDLATFDATKWERVLLGADADVLDRKVELFGSDRDAGAVEASLENAARAGIAAGSIDFTVAPISERTFPQRRGWLVTNPPYGDRISGGDLRDLADRLSSVVRERAASWAVALIAPPDAPYARRLGLVPATSTSNGGIPVSISTSAPSPSAPSPATVQPMAAASPATAPLEAGTLDRR